jgi:hypothetical protein
MALTMQRASTARVAGRRVAAPKMARVGLSRGKFVVQAAKKSVGDLGKVNERGQRLITRPGRFPACLQPWRCFLRCRLTWRARGCSCVLVSIQLQAIGRLCTCVCRAVPRSIHALSQFSPIAPVLCLRRPERAPRQGKAITGSAVLQDASMLLCQASRC